MKEEPSYRQPTKHVARRQALSRAIALMTSHREKAALVAGDHVEGVRRCIARRDPRTARACSDADVGAWRELRARRLEKKLPSDLMVAYFAGPNPTNDLALLLEEGVSAENVYAFECEPGCFRKAVDDLANSSLRGVKLMPMRMQAYFAATPRRFDIVYIDACGAFPGGHGGASTINVVSRAFSRLKES